jgi:small conductance mechanosensitive channel
MGLRSLLLAGLVAVIGVLALLLPMGVASAAEPAPDPAANPQQLQKLVETLRDDQRRAELLATLEALLAAQQKTEAEDGPPTLSRRLIEIVNRLADDGGEVVATLRQQAERWQTAAGSVADSLETTAAPSRGRDAAMGFITIFAAGWCVELVAWWLLRGSRRSLEAAAPAGFSKRLSRGALRGLLDLVPVALFAAAAYGTALLLVPPPAVQSMALNFVNAYAIARAAMALAQVLLSPAAPALRLLPLSDDSSRAISRWLWRIVGVSVGGYFLIGAFSLLGVPRRGIQFLFDMLVLLVGGVAIAFIVSQRRRLSGWLHRRALASADRFAVSTLLSALAYAWYLFAMAYVVAFVVISVFRIQGGRQMMITGTIATLLAALGAWLGIRLVAGVLRRPAAAADAPLDLASRLVAYGPLIRFLLAVLLVLAAVIAALQGWGVNVVRWLMGGGGERLLGAAFSIALTGVLAVLLWEVSNNVITRFLTHARNGTPVKRSARARTLLPLLQNIIMVVLAVIVVLIALSELGVNIGPLLAGAGVVGLAIGFGSQKLVQDVITGFFILVEDGINVGDVVQVGTTSGLVEDVSVRSIKLRDLSGNVHLVPFSAVDTVTNMSKGYSYYLLNIAVAYREDTDEVSRVCREIIDEMRQEPEFAPKILSPLEVLGLDSFADSAVIIKARIKTLPIEQWAVGREFNRRMKKRFDALGIEFPFPHQTVYFGVDKTGTAPPLHLHVDHLPLSGRERGERRPETAAPGRERQDVPEVSPPPPPEFPTAAMVEEANGQGPAAPERGAPETAAARPAPGGEPPA